MTWRHFFFSIRVFFHGHWQLTEQHSTASSRSRTSDIYLQLCTWDDYHIFLIATFVFARLLLDGIYHLIELLFDWLMMWCWFLLVCLLNWFWVFYSYLTWETGELELASTIILALQANRLTKYASHPKEIEKHRKTLRNIDLTLVSLLLTLKRFHTFS